MKKLSHSFIHNLHISLYIVFILLESFGQLKRISIVSVIGHKKSDVTGTPLWTHLTANATQIL